MALRSRSRTGSATSGPGRGPVSDGRTRRRRPHTHSRSRHRHEPAEELRRRAEILFAEHAGEQREPRTWPPTEEPEAGPEPETIGTHVLDTGTADGTPYAGIDIGSGADSVRGPGTWRERAGPALRERMPVWLQTRCALERRNVVALAVLLVVAAGFAVQHFWTGRTQSVRAPEVVRAAAPYGQRAPSGRGEPDASAGAPNTPNTAGTAGTAGPEIVVDVSGKVRAPGIHRLPAGSRVVDALRAAGGVRPGTSTDGLNRARFLVDGEQVIVGGPAPVSAAGTGGGGTAAGGSGGGAVPAAPVSLNTATVEQLDTLPGVGPVLAQHIVDFRAQHGGFRSVEQLREVNGIGDRRFADLRNLVRP